MERVCLALAPTDFRGGGFGAFEIQIADADTRTLFRHGVADLLPNAAAATGDHDSSILKAHLCLPLPPHSAAWQRQARSIKRRKP